MPTRHPDRRLGAGADPCILLREGNAENLQPNAEEMRFVGGADERSVAAASGRLGGGDDSAPDRRVGNGPDNHKTQIFIIVLSLAERRDERFAVARKVDQVLGEEMKSPAEAAILLE